MGEGKKEGMPEPELPNDSCMGGVVLEEPSQFQLGVLN